MPYLVKRFLVHTSQTSIGESYFYDGIPSLQFSVSGKRYDALCSFSLISHPSQHTYSLYTSFDILKDVRPLNPSIVLRTCCLLHKAGRHPFFNLGSKVIYKTYDFTSKDFFKKLKSIESNFQNT